MKKTVFLSFVFFFVFSFLPAFPQNVHVVDSSGNEFAFKFYHRYEAKEGNIFFSPTSISMAFAMVYEGARGQTADQIRSIFHFTEDENLRRRGINDFFDRLDKKDTSYELKIANALWVQKDYKLLETYYKPIEENYRGKAQNLDFDNAAEASRLTINAWVAQQTNDKIKDLLPEGSVKKGVRLVLTNAVYFKGKWLLEFDKEATREEDFYLTSSQTVKVQMMNLKNKSFRYAQTEGLQILELPYKGNEISMVILLPKGNNLKKLEETLSFENFSAWMKLLDSADVNVTMPRFKFKLNYDMAEELKEMGMVLAFSDKADFSGMDGEGKLFISDVFHQAYIDVNEEGTEAAAATGIVEMACSIGQEEKPIDFRADHPFVFLIRDRITGNILFLGRVENPNLV